MSDPKQEPIPCVGVICFRGYEVLLIRRGKAPNKGAWSIPGGRIEPGEHETEAALRELYEETAVRASLVDKVATLDAVFNGVAYRLHDYVAQWTQGSVCAGDDADHAEFVPLAKALSLPMWQKTKDVISLGYERLNAPR